MTGDLPPGLLTRVGEFYSWVADRRHEIPNVPLGLVAATSGVDRDVTRPLRAEGAVHELSNEDEVAVVHVGKDTLLMVKDDRPWRIAGAMLDGAPAWLGGPRILLVLGSDARAGQNQQKLRADSIHLVTADVVRQAGAIVGFPRDSWVQGPAGGSKFTNVMANRGPEVMLDTMENLTGLDVDGYVVVGFVGFEGLIGELGRLEINLPRAISSGIKGWQNYAKGEQKLGPTAALRLARIRKTLPGGDFARSANHGLIMLAGMTMVQAMGIDELPKMMDVLLKHAWTDLSTEDLLTWAAIAFVMPVDGLENMVLPGSVGTAAGQSVVFLGNSSDDIYADIADGVLDR